MVVKTEDTEDKLKKNKKNFHF